MLMSSCLVYIGRSVTLPSARNAADACLICYCNRSTWYCQPVGKGCGRAFAAGHLFTLSDAKGLSRSSGEILRFAQGEEGPPIVSRTRLHDFTKRARRRLDSRWERTIIWAVDAVLGQARLFEDGGSSCHAFTHCYLWFFGCDLVVRPSSRPGESFRGDG